jgi:hypothetical protein
LSAGKVKITVLSALIVAAAWTGLVRPAFFANPVQAKPAYMDRYNRDPYARPGLMDKCTVCHVGRGGDQRNDFGEAFEDAGYRITPKMRAKFSQLFAREPRQAER